MNPGLCYLCRREVEERCGDGVCRDCHKSLTFEECCDGSWTKDLRARAGLPPFCDVCGTYCEGCS
jgi:hypothetical protein